MSAIESLSALEILDSRGRPTVLATCRLKSGATGRASVPSGASTGSAEALELRDGDPARYGGLGCRRAVENVNTTIADALRGYTFNTQRELDELLIELDGTAHKSRLGANALLTVSLAFCRAVAAECGTELFQQFATVLAETGGTPPQRFQLPRPAINLFSGGRHAGQQVAIQDVLIVPTAPTMDECLAVAHRIYYTAARQAEQRYGMRLLRADEGGLAPPLGSCDEMLDAAMAAIHAAGYEPGRDVGLAVDVAATHFFAGGRYHIDGRELVSGDMIRYLLAWLGRYPIISLEDALAEEEWEAWMTLQSNAGSPCLLVGDDLLCTNPQRIQRAIESKAASALLLKVNQIGTLSEAATACRLARQAGWKVIASARSGETEDNWLADLAVGWAADQIKVGSITQSERLAKYNRLLELASTKGLTLAGA